MGLGIAIIEKSSIEWVGKTGSEMAGLSRRKGGPTLKLKCMYINKEPGYGIYLIGLLPIYLEREDGGGSCGSPARPSLFWGIPPIEDSRRD